MEETNGNNVLAESLKHQVGLLVIYFTIENNFLLVTFLFIVIAQCKTYILSYCIFPFM